jgi:hypothetical protein
MVKTFLILFLASSLSHAAATVGVTQMRGRVDPGEVSVHKKMKVTITVEVDQDPKRTPASVRLLRLHWSGNERPIGTMRDDGKKGDATANDGIYTCELKLKEKVVGLISFRVEANYPGEPVPILSQPIFMKVVGGVK